MRWHDKHNSRFQEINPKSRYNFEQNPPNKVIFESNINSFNKVKEL